MVVLVTYGLIRSKLSGITQNGGKNICCSIFFTKHYTIIIVC